MFGLFKPKMAPEGPVEIEMDVEIDRPAQEVFALIDYGDPRHHKAAVGTITRTGDASFDMVLDMLPDLTFPIDEIECVPGRSYTAENVLPEELGAPLLKTVERTEIEPLGEDSCKVIVTTIATFKPMRMKDFEAEVPRLALACNNALMKLKIHAEQGVEAIRDIEAQQIPEDERGGPAA